MSLSRCMVSFCPGLHASLGGPIGKLVMCRCTRKLTTCTLFAEAIKMEISQSSKAYSYMYITGSRVGSSYTLSKNSEFEQSCDLMGITPTPRPRRAATVMDTGHSTWTSSEECQEDR